MAPEVYTLIVMAVVVVAYLVHRVLVGGHEFRKFAGKMLVTCPENQKTVAVNVASGRAALAAMVGKEHVELNQCTRWPEKEDCDQACLRDLTAAPEMHSVWGIAAKWYQGKNCAYCHRPISELSHLDHPPALIDFEGKLIEWNDVPAEKLPEELAAARAVCWNCSVVEGFRHAHPELVIERPWAH